MELALSLEKLNYSKLIHLDKLATEAGDYNLADYVDAMLDGACFCRRQFLSGIASLFSLALASRANADARALCAAARAMPRVFTSAAGRVVGAQTRRRT
jgi:hypothetical protein